jgi:2-amino-4-hydroxy-6-hydroxymethyldihydropteridine diphosphokinase
MAKAAIGVGGSLGDREATVRAALAALGELPRTRLLAASRLHETAPVGGVAQRPFINACAVVDTDLPPRELLDELLRIETRFDRVRIARWEDRTLDLDLLLYDDLVLDDPACTIPHPEMHRRAFVLAPLAEIAGEWVVPGLGKTVGELLRVVAAEPGEERPH